MIKSFDFDLYWGSGTTEHWQRFWKKTHEMCLSLENVYLKNREVLCLVDIGAGSLEIDKRSKKTPAFKYFSLRKKRLIAIMKNRSQCFESVRKREDGYWKGKSFGEFQRAEFADSRTKIYDLGSRIDIPNGSDLLLKQIERILKKRVRRDRP